MTQRDLIRVLLADDHDLFRQGLASLINNEPDMKVVAQAGDGLTALSMARETKPDLIVMDINMPISNGLEATKLIRRYLPEANIVMLTIRDEDETLFKAIRAGAKGYILKNANSTEFLEGLRQVMDGEAVLPPKMALRLLDEFARLANQPETASPPQEDYGLTGRERDVLRYVAIGATDKEIASQLHISISTVKSHMRNILSKLHAVNRREAARLAKDEGLIDDLS